MTELFDTSQPEPYVTVQLTLEQYDDLIKAAGMKAQAVVACFNKYGTWSEEAKAADPGFDTPDPLEEVQAQVEPQAEPQVEQPTVEPQVEPQPDLPVQTDLDMPDPEIAPDEITG